MAVTTQTNEQVRPFPWQQSQSDRRTSRTENRETRRIMYSIQFPFGSGSVKSDRADQKFEEIDGAKSGFLSRI
ncbi:hypothetical protein HZH68_006704 [Vespula germanica]|uniref:Uncharacterized protein n=1 Tax=Vespula germanica TaxID=30212 RepID=A0A834NCG5_VESGE|nr:hypothetical protein HZH68_006704 [Vespula germanica]